MRSPPGSWFATQHMVNCTRSTPWLGYPRHRHDSDEVGLLFSSPRALWRQCLPSNISLRVMSIATSPDLFLSCLFPSNHFFSAWISLSPRMHSSKYTLSILGSIIPWLEPGDRPYELAISLAGLWHGVCKRWAGLSWPCARHSSRAMTAKASCQHLTDWSLERATIQPGPSRFPKRRLRSL
jgi:hypothetical protein